jgi:hypothetical protein
MLAALEKTLFSRSFSIIFQLNADQEYCYSDEQLIEMLQEATAAQRK